MDELTPRQTEILEFIRRHLGECGMPPTRAEIVEAFGFRSPNAAEDHLRALARRGMIELRAGASRGIRLLDRGTATPASAANDGIPLVGRVAAGAPILATESVESWFKIDRHLFHTAPDFLLRVQGWSMRDAGILPGDLLAVKRTPSAENGQIIVARIGEEVTVKRFERIGKIVRLLPANPDFSPIRIDLSQQELDIEGRAVGLIRADGFDGLKFASANTPRYAD